MNFSRSESGRYWLKGVMGSGALVVMAAIGLLMVCGVCLALLTSMLVPLPGPAPWFQDPGDPGVVVSPGGADLLAARVISGMVGGLHSLFVIWSIAVGCCLLVWASLAAVDVLSSRGDKGWWRRALAGTLALVALGSLVAVVHASTIVTVTACVAVALAAAALPSAPRAATHRGRGRRLAG